MTKRGELEFFLSYDAQEVVWNENPGLFLFDRRFNIVDLALGDEPRAGKICSIAEKGRITSIIVELKKTFGDEVIVEHFAINAPNTPQSEFSEMNPPVLPNTRFVASAFYHCLDHTTIQWSAKPSRILEDMKNFRIRIYAFPNIRLDLETGMIDARCSTSLQLEDTRNDAPLDSPGFEMKAIAYGVQLHWDEEAAIEAEESGKIRQDLHPIGTSILIHENEITLYDATVLRYSPDGKYVELYAPGAGDILDKIWRECDSSRVKVVDVLEKSTVLTVLNERSIQNHQYAQYWSALVDKCDNRKAGDPGHQLKLQLAGFISEVVREVDEANK